MSDERVRIYTLPRLVYPAERPAVQMRIQQVAVPLLDALASAGQNIPLSPRKQAEVQAKLDKFKKERGSLLQEALELHFRREDELFYSTKDPQGVEAMRMMVSLSIAMHLHKSIDALWAKTRALKDIGSASLFEMTLEKAGALLGPEFYSRTTPDITLGFLSIEDTFASCKRRCGLPVLTVDEIVHSTAHDVVAYTLELLHCSISK